MSQNGESTSEVQERTVERLLSIESESSLSSDDSPERQEFLRQAFRSLVAMLAENRLSDRMDYNSVGSPGIDEYRDVDELLTEEAVQDVDVRQNGWHSPKVTVWLADTPPQWANTADRRGFRFAVGAKNYNGNPAHAVLDVRPF